MARRRPVKLPLLNTLRVRFALWTAGLLLLVLVSAGAFVYLALARSLSNAIDSGLKLNASQALTTIEFEDGELDLPQSFLEGPETIRLRSGEIVLRILGEDGGVLGDFGTAHTLPILTESLSAAVANLSDLDTVADPESESEFRVYTAAITVGERVVGYYQIGQSLEEMQNTLRQLLNVMLIGIPIAALLAGIGGYLLAARALAPIDAMTRTAFKISGEDLSARLPPPETKDEVGRLALTFNEMLARLDNAFGRERQFTADASHELRTPLAAMQAILDVTGEKARSVKEYKSALADLEEEVARLRNLAENLLLLARNHDPKYRRTEEINLSELLSDVNSSMTPLAAEKGLQISCHVPPNLIVPGDMDSLIRLFANLLDNAIKYTTLGEVEISAQRCAGGDVEVTIRDTGDGIDQEQLPYIFKRFYRSEKSRSSDGFGLGLAIAKATVEDHGGEIEVTSELAKGTRVVVRLPGPSRLQA